MNRKQRRALAKQERQNPKVDLDHQHTYVSRFPEKLTALPPSAFPKLAERLPDACWVSRHYLVQKFVEGDGSVVRLSICRTKLGKDGRWEDGLTWDELQSIKREVGYGHWYAVEIYPRDVDIVNVANFRHLWCLEKPLALGWFKEEVSSEARQVAQFAGRGSELYYVWCDLVRVELRHMYGDSASDKCTYSMLEKEWSDEYDVNPERAAHVIASKQGWRPIDE